MPRESKSDSDILWGAEEIGAEIRRTAQQVYYLHERGLIPTRKVSHRAIVAISGELRRHFAAEKSET